MNQQNKNVNKMVKIAVLISISVVLMYFDFPVLPAFPWLMIDLSEVPALMGGFAYGPLTGGVIVVLKVLLRFLIKGSSSALVGEFANIVIGLSLVVPAAWFYCRNKSKKTAILGMVLGALVMQVIAIAANIYVFLPLFNMKLEGAALMQYITAGIMPFNGIKAVLVSVGTYILYKRVSLAVFKVDHKFESKNKKQIA